MMANKGDEVSRSIEELIVDFCIPILTKKDYLDLNGAVLYVQSLNDEEQRTLHEAGKTEYELKYRAVLQTVIFNYIESFQQDDLACTPFAFDNGDSYQKYRIEFAEEYSRIKNGADLPVILVYAFGYIDKASETYRMFEKFDSTRRKEIDAMVDLKTNTALIQLETKAESAAISAAEKAAENAAVQATVTAKYYADQAAKNAETAAKKEADAAVNDKMSEVSAKISETSVTILGMFSAIVLTMVAGLVYSSSVIENINTADFYKLLCIAALIGLVCFNLIIAMFRFIAKIGGKNKSDKEEKTHFFSDKITIFINCVLVFVMIFGFVAQMFFPSQNLSVGADKQSSSNTTVCVSTSNDSTYPSITTEANDIPE